MYEQQCFQLTGTNSQLLDRIDPVLQTDCRFQNAECRLKDAIHAKLRFAVHAQTTLARCHLIQGSRNADRLWIFNLQSKICNLQSQEISGDHTRVATPVPIPNTAVKRAGPMLVRTARK